MNNTQILLQIAHYAEHLAQRSDLLKWLINTAPHSVAGVTERTSKQKIARIFAIQFMSRCSNELERTVEQTIARERARTKYETWLIRITEAIRTGEYRRPSEYLANESGRYYTIKGHLECDSADWC